MGESDDRILEAIRLQGDNMKEGLGRLEGAISELTRAMTKGGKNGGWGGAADKVRDNSLASIAIVLIFSVGAMLMSNVNAVGGRVDVERLDRIAQGQANEAASIARHQTAIARQSSDKNGINTKLRRIEGHFDMFLHQQIQHITDGVNK
jgi:hypothetical protein